MDAYNYKAVEEKWQQKWKSSDLYKTIDTDEKEKCYVLDMFPYPSGDGLHVGHARIYTSSDIYSRFKRMQGMSVLHPTGWDAFGLPAEQFAINNQTHPQISVDKNIANFRRQMEMLGLSYDFDREVNTTDPNYYKWTQWIFLKLYEKGLAYESYEPINWCPKCQTGLANEDLENGKCERCGSDVVKKPMRQWILRITDYADRMLDDLDLLPLWPEWLKELQKNWIGKSEGAEFDFELTDIPEEINIGKSIKIFTTRPDTIFGATFLAISGGFAKEWIKQGWEADDNQKKFIDELVKNEESNLYDLAKEKLGMPTGIYAINPGTKEKIPVWIANYVLGSVGTGAIMAVPAHDDRDFEFATKYKLPIIRVIYDDKETDYTVAHTGDGKLVNSGDFDDLTSTEAKIKITMSLGGKITKRYRLADWVFSRQRYWGEPIPMVHDENNRAWPLDESELPLVLPAVENYAPSGTGESPLANILSWINVKGYITDKGTVKIINDENDAGGKEIKSFKRESNTMPQWAGSSWYYLRFADPLNSSEIISKNNERKWLPVDVYVGGAEHATRHLIYARFWHKFLNDIGVVSSPEPFSRLESVGLVLGADGQKMSKRTGNVVNPDDVVNIWGTDVVRTYIAFMGSFYDSTVWDGNAIVGCRRFLDKVIKISTLIGDDIEGVTRELHRTIKKVTNDIENFKFNTAVSQMMIFINTVEENGSLSKENFKVFLRLLTPFAPHMSEELWEKLGEEESVHKSAWPKWDEDKIVDTETTIVFQVNGKIRGTIKLDRGASEVEVLEAVKALDGYKKHVGNTPLKKTIFVVDRLINLVI